MVKFVLLVHTRMFVSVYVWCTYGLTTNTMPTRIVCAPSHLLLTLHRGNQITMETESERESEVYQYTFYINKSYSTAEVYLSAYNNDVASKVRSSRWSRRPYPLLLVLSCSLQTKLGIYLNNLESPPMTVCPSMLYSLVHLDRDC